nr:sensor histidine kinase [Kibdelosporangium sp. MJ126-NF4]
MRSVRLPRMDWRDPALAVGLTLFLVLGTPLVPRGQGIEVALDPLGYALLAIPGLALTFRRTAPVTVLIVTLLATFAYYHFAYPGIFQPCAVLVSLYTVAALGARWVALVSGLLLCGGLLVISVRPAEPLSDGVLWVGGWCAAVIVAAETARQRRAYLNEVEQRAVDALRTKEETARLRATEERLRIARELHDSLTHAISLVNAQVNVAVHLLDRDPARSRAALFAVKDASKQAMGELRSALDVLRPDDEPQPTRSLERLADLVDASAHQGVAVTVTVSGDSRPLAHDVDLAAYRIIQESLTNAARHSTSATVSVDVRYGSDTVTVCIEDDGDADGAVREGVGIRGMRERVAALGGELAVGPRPTRGFAVKAVLPLGPADDNRGTTP